MNDADLESRVRTTLAAVAAATPLEPAVDLAPRTSRLARPLLAAAVATAVLLGAVAFATLNNDTPTTVNTPANPANPEGTGLPNGFDPATANPVFSAPGDPDAVVTAYLKSRFPDYPNPGVIATRLDLTATTAIFAWTTGGPTEGVIASGRILLRRTVERWAVVAATTDGVDLAEVGYANARVTGTVRTTNSNSLTARVLTPSGKPVLHAPTEESFADGALSIDVAAKFQPVVVRVQLVGGTQLSISEVRFDPPPLAPHRDHGACFESLRALDAADDPPQDFVGSACLAALQGAAFLEGSAGDRIWQLVTADEPTGRMVRLRGRDLAGGFSDMAAPGPSEPSDRLAPMLIGCCTLGDYSLVAGAFHQRVAALRVTLPGGKTYEAPAVPDPAAPEGTRYAVVAIPIADVSAPGGTVKAEVRLADGSWHEVEGAPRPPLVLALPRD